MCCFEFGVWGEGEFWGLVFGEGWIVVYMICFLGGMGFVVRGWLVGF
jgi:hypothetical protein